MKTSIPIRVRLATSPDGPVPRRDYGQALLKCGHLGSMDGHLLKGSGKRYAWCAECDCERLILKGPRTWVEVCVAKGYLVGKSIQVEAIQEELF